MPLRCPHYHIAAQELLARGLTPQDINAGLLATFGHSEQDLAQPALEFAMQDLPVLPLARWQEARGRAADPALCECTVTEASLGWIALLLGLSA